MTKTKLENDKIKATEKIEARKDKTTRQGQVLQFAGSAARAAGPLIGALSHIQDKKYFLNLNPLIGSSIADIPSYVNGGIRVPGTNGINYINDYLVQFTQFLPTIGQQYKNLQESDINTGFFRLHALLKSMNSRFSSTEAGDLGQILYGGLELICAIANAKRVLACTTHVDASHVDLAERFVAALGFDYDDLQQKWKIYAGRLNILIDKANAIVRVPADWSLLNHRLAYNSFVHMDRSKGTIAYHLLVQAMYGIYEEDAAAVVYDNSPEMVAGAGILFSYYLDFIANMLQAYQNTSIINDFTSDMDNAATRGLRLYTIEYFDLNHPQVMFSVDEGMGDTIRNMTADAFVCRMWDGGNLASLTPSMLNIKQDVNGFLYQGILPDSDDVSADTIVFGWGTVDAWYNNVSTGGPLFIPYNVLLASDFSGATSNNNFTKKYVGALDVCDANTDIGGILESTRLQYKLETVALFTRLSGAPSTTGHANLPHITVLGTEVPTYSGYVGLHAATIKTYNNVDDQSVDLSVAALGGFDAYGFHPIITFTTAGRVTVWNADVHKLVYVPEDNLANVLRMGTLSLFFIDAPLSLGGTRK